MWVYLCWCACVIMVLTIRILTKRIALTNNLLIYVPIINCHYFDIIYWWLVEVFRLFWSFLFYASKGITSGVICFQDRRRKLYVYLITIILHWGGENHVFVRTIDSRLGNLHPCPPPESTSPGYNLYELRWSQDYYLMLFICEASLQKPSKCSTFLSLFYWRFTYMLYRPLFSYEK